MRFEWNHQQIEEDRETILEMIVSHEAENAPLESLIETYKSSELRYWRKQDLTVEDIIKMIERRELSEELSNEYKECMATCEYHNVCPFGKECDLEGRFEGEE